MADSEPNPNPEPTPEPAPQRRRRSSINKRHLLELQLATEVANAASKAEYAPQLAGQEIAETDVSGLLEDIDQANRRVGEAMDKTLVKENATSDEDHAKRLLIGYLQKIQKAAKQKSTHTGDKTLLKKYVVGDKFYSSRSLLEATATKFLGTAAADQLPGIKAAVISEIQATLNAYKAAQGGQSTAQSNATHERATLEVAVADITRRRREIQIAADAIWPSGNKANAAIRREFKLPAKGFK